MGADHAVIEHVLSDRDVVRRRRIAQQYAQALVRAVPLLVAEAAAAATRHLDLQSHHVALGARNRNDAVEVAAVRTRPRQTSVRIDGQRHRGLERRLRLRIHPREILQRQLLAVLGRWRQANGVLILPELDFADERIAREGDLELSCVVVVVAEALSRHVVIEACRAAEIAVQNKVAAIVVVIVVVVAQHQQLSVAVDIDQRDGVTRSLRVAFDGASPPIAGQCRAGWLRWRRRHRRRFEWWRCRWRRRCRRWRFRRRRWRRSFACRRG